jgi:hypothetical protein
MILHKPKKEAPLDVPTLPLAPPAASPAAAPPASSSGGAAAGASGGSPTGALTPYPGGAASLGRGGGLRGSLLGCANAEAVGLSPEERARCNERFGEDLAHAPVLDGIDPAKRAAFGAAAARAERDHERDEAIAKSRDTSKPSDPGGIAHGAGSALVFPHNVWDPVVPGDPH